MASVIWTLIGALFWLLIQTIRHTISLGVGVVNVFVPAGGLKLVAGITGVVSLLELLAGVGSAPLAPSSAIEAVLEIWVTPFGSGVFTFTANVAVWLPLPAATAPTARVQVEPAFPFGVQDQPAVLAAALKVVLVGTVSVSTTPVAPRLPTLE